MKRFEISIFLRRWRAHEVGQFRTVKKSDVKVDGFPYMFIVAGPHTALGNIPGSIEYNVEWIGDILTFMRERGLTYTDAEPKSVERWTDVVRKNAEGLLSNEIDSWMTGVNQNVEGKQVRILARYSGTNPNNRAWCNDVAAQGYRGLARN